MTKTYSKDEVFKSTLEYFKGDELATNVWINKYNLKDSEGNLYELKPDDMHQRLAKEFARIEAKYPNPMSKDEIFNLLKDFKYIVPQGSPMSGVGNDFQIVSLSNCYVVNNKYDSYGSIIRTDEEIVQLCKRRGGVGTDLSHIRPKGSPVKNSALTSTGVAPFMERYSNSIREVAQNGRRGALMLSESIKSMDSEEFIDAKIEQGKVTGANISVKIDDEFVNCVLDNKKYIQQYPIDSKKPQLKKEIDAKKLWDKIIHNAWKSAEPGVLFWDTIIKESLPDCYAEDGFDTVSTNPCIIGSSLVGVADGRNAVSIEQLTKEGKDVPVYSKNDDGKVEIKWGRNPRKTGIKKEVWKLTLDDGSEFISTPEHLIFMKNNIYKRLDNLIEGDSISSFYSCNSNNGYRQIMNSGDKFTKSKCYRSRRQYRLIHEFYKGKNIDYKLYSIHHKDFDNQNDFIDNLELMSREEHKFLHSDRIKGENNPWHRFTDEQKFKFASHPGDKNPKYINVSNDEILNHAKQIYKENGILTKKIWIKYAKEHGLPQFLGNSFRFKTFTDFKNQVVDNHKVVKVEFYGYEDVYNITVDDNHNYIVINSNEDEKFITSGGICVKNCGEIPLCDADSCRLMAINLYSYVDEPFTKKAKFNEKLFIEHVQKAQRLMDDLLDLELEKLQKIIEKIESDPEPLEIKQDELNLWNRIYKKCLQGRRTGLGVTAEGDMLAALEYRYGTKEATKFSVKVHKLLATNAYKSSAILAGERGPFEIYNREKEVNNPFLNRLFEDDKELKELTLKNGRRNIAQLTIAPTGSLSLLTQTTSGIEPVFMIFYKRRRKVNPSDKDVKIVFVDESNDSWEEYNVFHPKFLKWLKVNDYNVEEVKKMDSNELEDIIKLSPYYLATSRDIDWLEKVRMQGQIQKYVDHSISCTHNLPSDITEEMVGSLYIEAHKVGCKGITVYREGSRSGVLIADVKEPKQNKNEGKSVDDLIKENNAPKRQKSLECDVMRFTNKGDKWIGFIGLLKGKPYEIFTGSLDSFSIPTYVEKGSIIKNKDSKGESRYDFVYTDKDGYEQEMRGLSRAFNREYWNTAKMVSAILRHGMPIPSIINLIDSLHIDEDVLGTWKSGVKRMLKKYIKEGTQIGNICPECNQNTLIFTNGCVQCTNCSYSKCG
jgi:ribonucleotide reductase alpha subunit